MKVTELLKKANKKLPTLSPLCFEIVGDEFCIRENDDSIIKLKDGTRISGKLDEMPLLLDKFWYELNNYQTTKWEL